MSKKIEPLVIDERGKNSIKGASVIDIYNIATKLNEVIEFLNKREQVRK